MAHNCPYCDDLCYCDIEDTMLEAPDDCSHVCNEEREDDDDE